MAERGALGREEKGRAASKDEGPAMTARGATKRRQHRNSASKQQEALSTAA